MLLFETMWGQQSTPSPVLAEQTFSFSYEAPKSVHEYAVSELRAYVDYINSPRKIGQYVLKGNENQLAFRYGINFGAGEQYFSVDRDGQIILHGITAEDALLLMVAERSRESLEFAQRYDRQEESREKERRDHPPATLKSGKKTFKISNVPEIAPHVL